MRVVELDGYLPRERVPVGIGAAEAAHQIRQRAGDEKVLLHEPQCLPQGRGVVGIEDSRQRFGGEPLGQRAHELTVAERLKVEGLGRRSRPKAQRVDRLAAVAHHRAIEGQPDQVRGSADDGLQSPAAHLDGAVHPDLHLLLRAGNFPRVRLAQPVVRLLVLPTVLDGLLEDPVFVPEPVAHGRQLHRGHRVDEAGRQPPQPAVPQPCVGLLLEHAQPIEAFLRDDALHLVIEPQVHDVVGQRAPKEELHGQVVDAFGILALVRLLGPQPAL